MWVLWRVKSPEMRRSPRSLVVLRRDKFREAQASRERFHSPEGDLVMLLKIFRARFFFLRRSCDFSLLLQHTAAAAVTLRSNAERRREFSAGVPGSRGEEQAVLVPRPLPVPARPAARRRRLRAADAGDGADGDPARVVPRRHDAAAAGAHSGVLPTGAHDALVAPCRGTLGFTQVADELGSSHAVVDIPCVRVVLNRRRGGSRTGPTKPSLPGRLPSSIQQGRSTASRRRRSACFTLSSCRRRGCSSGE